VHQIRLVGCLKHCDPSLFHSAIVAASVCSKTTIPIIMMKLFTLSGSRAIAIPS